ncbi:MAG: hypothetical protein ABI699_09520 [Caldimonas sp.]
MKSDVLEPGDWCRRCALRLAELDGQLSHTEALTIAQDVHAFERTRAMDPETAAEFVADMMSKTEPPRFERRSPDRPDRAPFLRSLMRMLGPTRRLA